MVAAGGTGGSGSTSRFCSDSPECVFGYRMPSHVRRLAAVLAAAAGVALLIPPAAAERIVAVDPTGDGEKGSTLDIGEIVVRNRDRALVTTVHFGRAALGDLIFLVQARGKAPGEWAHIVNHHRRPEKGDTTWLATIDGKQPCAGLRVTWDHPADTATLRLPSRCFEDGDYGDVHLRVLTERTVDVDWYAPTPDDDSWRWTPWAARG